MKYSKTYFYGDYCFKTYCKPVGQGYEIGLTYNNKSLFVGNFVHKKEAAMWWRKMHTYMKHFTLHYKFSEKMPSQWYCTFLSNHIHKNYYSFLDQLFSKYNKTYNMAFTRDFKKYKNYQKRFDTESFYDHKLKVA